MPNVGESVAFRVWDSLFRKCIKAIGIIKHRLYGKLWVISAKNQSGLHPDFKTYVHEDNINA